MDLRYSMKRIIFILCIIACTGTLAFSQPQYKISINNLGYHRGFIQFNLFNNSDTGIKVAFKFIEKEKQKDVLKYYNIAADTLIFELLPEKKIVIQMSHPTEYIIDGEPFGQRAIASYGTLRVFVRMKKKYMSSLKYVKMILPSGEDVTEKIAL